MRRTGVSTGAFHAAYHESGHACANVLAWRNVWPKPPSPFVRHVEISDHDGEWIGRCSGVRAYQHRSPVLMERAVICHLSGGIAEAIYRGAGERDEVLDFAIRHCGCNTDLQRARALIDELRTLTGVRHTEQQFALRTRWMLLQHWDCVERLATELIAHGRIEGDQVTRIIDHVPESGTRPAGTLFLHPVAREPGS
jgi:hypothetical protein